MYRVFLSHSRRDNAAAQALFRWLTQVEPSLKGEIFLDVNPQTGFAPGVRWKSELARAVDRCEAVICLISPHWEESGECVAEARLAESLNKRVFCARIDPAAQGDRVREWQICDLFADGREEEITVESDDGDPVVFSADGLARLLRGLREAGIGAEYFPWPPEDDKERAPYRGWQSMEDADAAVFFGRDAQILRGLDALRGMRATAVESLFVILGPSGVGKSSFLRAGLLPRLRRDHQNFLVSEIVRPERAAVTGDHGLAQAIWQLRSQAGAGGPALGDVKAACMNADTARLSAWLREAQRDAAGEGVVPTVVLPIDQGEELFSVAAGTESSACLTLLGALLQTGAIDSVPLIAVMTIRADRYQSLQEAPELLDVHTREFGELKPMPLTEYKDVITGPAERATAAGLRLDLDPALVDRLLADATGGADSLPLMALTLSRLYLDYGSTGRLTLANYEAMGGMARIVETEIDKLLAADPDQRAQQLDTLRAAFIPWLATIDPDTDAPSRRVANWSEVPPDSHELIDAMVARRLLVKDDRGGQTVVEVALESLLRQWDSLAKWLREQAAGLKSADSLERAAAEWERNERSPGWLIGGVRLAAAQELADSPVFGDRVRHSAEFLEASREHQDAEAKAELLTAQAHAAALRKRARILRTVLAATLVVALVAVITSVLAVRASNAAEARSREALAGRLTSQVQAMLAGARPGTELEVIDKALAAQLISEKDGIGAPLSVLSKKPRVEKVFEAAPTDVSGDGRRIVARAASGMQLLDAATGGPIGEPFAPDAISGALSFDARYVAMAGKDLSIRVWDSDTRSFIGQPMRGNERFVGNTMAVTSDARRVAAVDGNNNLRLWDVQTGRPIESPLTGHQGRISGLAFSPDGHRLASAGDDNTVRLWDADLGKALRELRNNDQSSLMNVAFSADGQTIAAIGVGVLMNNKAPLWIWNAADGTIIDIQSPGNFNAFFSVAFSDDGTQIVTGGDDNTVRLWNARNGAPIGDPVHLQGPPLNVAFIPGNHQVVSTSGDTVQVVDTDPHSGLIVETTGGKAAKGPTSYGLVTTKDGQRIVEFSSNTMRWLDIDTGHQIAPTIGSDAFGGVHKIDFSADDRWLALLSWDNVVRVVDASTGQAQGDPIEMQDERVTSMEFSPDGQILATAITNEKDNRVRLWDWRRGQPIGDAMGGHEFALDSVTFSRDGRRIYSLSADSVGIWDAATQRSIAKLTNVRAHSAMTISQDGKRLAVAGFDYIQEFDAEDGHPVGPETRGHGQIIKDIAYSADGRYLASVGMDHTVRFWDVASRTQIGDAVDTTATGNPTDVEFSSDDRRVFITADANAVPGPTGGLSAVGGGIWELPAPPAWADELCKKLVSNPTPDQWKQWITTDPNISHRELCQGKSAPS